MSVPQWTGPPGVGGRLWGSVARFLLQTEGDTAVAIAAVAGRGDSGEVTGRAELRRRGLVGLVAGADAMPIPDFGGAGSHRGTSNAGANLVCGALDAADRRSAGRLGMRELTA